MTGVRVVVSLGCSGGGGAVYTARRRTAAATGMDFGFDLGAAAVAARRAAGVRLCGRARQRCNPCTHPHRRRRHYPAVQQQSTATAAFRPSEWVRACAVPMWARPATTDSPRRALRAKTPEYCGQTRTHSGRALRRVIYTATATRFVYRLPELRCRAAAV